MTSHTSTVTPLDFFPVLDYARVTDVEKENRCLLSVAEVSSTVYRTVNFTMKVFEEEDLYINTDDTLDVPPSGANLIPPANNQKSLLIVETYFLVKCLKLLSIGSNERYNLLYIGGSPGNHLNNLAEMFPMITFHVYDSLEMPKIVERDNLIKHQELFTDSNVIPGVFHLMISDMRDKNYNADPKSEEEIERNASMIVKDMDDQKRWFKALQVKYALLRFRPLRSSEAKLMKRSSFTYLTGVHLLFPFSKPKTNSTMLYVEQSCNEELYFDNDVINRLKYHNNCVRNGNIYLNPFTRKFEALLNIETIKGMGKRLDLGAGHYVMNCGWDCRYTYFVFVLYLKMCLAHRGCAPDYLKQIRGLSDVPKKLIDEFILEHFSHLENKVEVPSEEGPKQQDETE